MDFPDGKLTYFPHFLDNKTADDLFIAIKEQTPWKQEYIQLFGKKVAMPRLTCWYGDEGSDYTYSGLQQVAMPWTATLSSLRELLEAQLRFHFNSVLLNYYRTGSDSMGWHADDEPELGRNPVIASLNLGQSRTFQLKHRQQKDFRKEVLLTHGSLLVMHGALQHHWVHAVPKRMKQQGERINLTFREIKGEVGR